MLVRSTRLLLALILLLLSLKVECGELEDLNYVLTRTVHLGNCSGVILPPVKDKNGNWHWFVASAAHCATGGNRKVEILYPADGKQEFTGREIVRYGGGGNDTDILIIEFTPSSGQTLFAEIAGIDQAKPSATVLVTGFPARGAEINQRRELSGLVWKPATLVSTKGMVNIDQTIWSGNSGGPVWYGKRVLGIASTSNYPGYPVESHFSGPESIHKAYHEAAQKVGARACSDDSSCWEWLKPKPGREPYRAPPNEELVKFSAKIVELEQKIAELTVKLNSLELKHGNDGKSASVRIGDVRTVSDKSPARVFNTGNETDVVLNFEIPQGKEGADGNDGEDGQDGKTPTAAELLVLINNVFNARKEELRGSDGVVPLEWKEQLDSLANHTFRLHIMDKEGNPVRRRDGKENVTTFSFTKDGELWLIPVGQ